MKLLTIPIFLFVLHIFCIGQPVDTVKIAQIADSVLAENTSQDFYHYLKRNCKGVTKCEWIPISANIDHEKLNDTTYIKDYVEFNYMVGYDFKLNDGDVFRLKDDTADCIFWGAPIVSIYIDSGFNVDKTPNFENLQTTYDRLHKAELIKKDRAINMSQKYFYSQEEVIDAVLEYDLITDKLYWRCTKTQKIKYRLKKYTFKLSYEHVLINAENGGYMCNEIRKYGIYERTQVIVK